MFHVPIASIPGTLAVNVLWLTDKRLPRNTGVVICPDAFNAPDTFVSILLITITFAVPFTPTVTLPPAVEILTLLLPLLMFAPPAAITPVNKLPFPLKKFAVTKLPKFALLLVTLPDIAKLLNVPTLVILGCALV